MARGGVPVQALKEEPEEEISKAGLQHQEANRRRIKCESHRFDVYACVFMDAGCVFVQIDTFYYIYIYILLFVFKK